jgi:hypothetical protein
VSTAPPVHALPIFIRASKCLVSQDAELENISLLNTGLGACAGEGLAALLRLQVGLTLAWSCLIACLGGGSRSGSPH